MLKIKELYKQKEDIKKEIIEEIEGIIKANKNNIYCDHYQLQDMIEEIFKLYAKKRSKRHHRRPE